MNSRRKGKDGELELAEFLREHGWTEARRGQQFHGGGDSPDIVGGPKSIHIECKRVEAGNPYDWLDQAERDAEGTGKTAVVFHRRSRRDWIVVMSATDFMQMVARSEDY